METVTLQVPESQLIDWIRQLSPRSKQAILRELIADLDELDALVDYGDQRIRQLCAKRGMEWDRLTENQRQRLIDELLHNR